MMRRDNNAGNNNFHGPPYTPQQPTITFLAFPPKPHQQPRETQTTDLPQPLHPKNSEAPNNRLSHDVGPTQSNNAFAHLRNEISNLRSEFTRLIQKDPVNPLERGQGEVRGSFGVRRQDRLPTYSTMGFYNTVNAGEVASESNREPTSINFKNKTVGLEKSPLEIEIDKKRQITKNEDPNSRLHKRYSNQFTDKKPQPYLMPMVEPAQEHTKMQELEIQIRKLGELKHRAEEENIFLRRELTKRETEYFEKVQLLTNDLDKSRIVIDQANISLSLKNSLVQKLEKEIERYLQEIQISQKQTSSAQEQTLRLRQKYETQIRNLEGIHMKNIDDIIEKYRAAEERIHRLGIENTSKEESINYMQKKIQELQEFQNSKKECDNLIEQLQRTSVAMKEQIKRLQSNLEEKQAKIQTLLANLQQAQKISQQPPPSQLNQQILSRFKQIEQENIDLKKRVQSYKKTVEQLNNSNNSSREKQVVFKEQVKLLKQQNKKHKDEIKILAQQVHIKQSLITSLYRDISILDNEIRVSAHLKNLLAHFSRYIDELNGRIISLQSQKLNAKYAE